MAMQQLEMKARMEIGQALLSLPSSLSDAYAMAVRFAPQIVMAESDPLRFFVLEKNIQGAAFKLAFYWSTRYRCFGERAFLPMNISGMGTLSNQDIAALRESCVQRIPNYIHGQAVYIIKASTIASSLTASGIRALFYQFHLAKTETECILLLVVDDSDNTDTRSIADLETFFTILSELVCQALPVKVFRVLIISSPPTTPAKSMHSERVQRIVQSSLSTQVVVVTKEHSQEFLDKLESFGITRPGVSPVLASIFGSVPKAAMIPQTISLEHTQDECYRWNVAHGNRHPYAPSSLPGVSASNSSIQEKEEEKAFQAPPALKRRAVSFSPEEGPCRKSIKACSHTNKKECQRKYPHQQATVDEAKETDATIRNKKRNALYSRRKYERKKIEFEVMKKEAHRHRVQNANLLQEHQRLEQLFAQAVKCVKMREQDLLVDDHHKVGVQGMQQKHAHASILETASFVSSPIEHHAAAAPVSSSALFLTS